MKKIFNKSERGSIMIEALAMLALIALVTPLLYKKTSERMRELQDINSASELRTIIKAVDDYIGSNYDEMVKGGTITNNCASSVKTQSYAGLKNDKVLSVPIGHFCEFLPYGVLKNDGTAQVSKLFKDYKIVLKLQGSSGQSTEGTKRDNYVITAFVVTDPQVDMPQLRSSSIASMIGGNGGYVSSNTDNSGTTESNGTISGNLGLWGIADTSTELGITVKKGAVVAASIQGISSQNANIDIDDVLYRRARAQKDLNTMFTTLYMGSSGSDSFGHDIVNISSLIVGQRSKPSGGTNDRLYIKSGNIHMGGAGNIQLDGKGDVLLKGTENNITINTKGSVSTKKGDFTTSEGKFTSAKSGSLELTNSLDTAIKVNTNAFTVSKTGVTSALKYIANRGTSDVTLHDDAGDVKMDQPVVITSEGDCAFNNASGCALQVAGSGHFGKNLYIGETFSAKNLHAREKLTVGGDTAGTGPALSVVYTDGNKSTLSFGNDLLKVTESGSKLGSLDFASSMIAASKTSATAATFKVAVPNATGNEISLNTNTSLLKLTPNKAEMQANSNNSLVIDNGNVKVNTTNVYFNKPSSGTAPFQFTGGGGSSEKIDTLVTAVRMTPKSPSTTGGYFEVNKSDTYGQMVVKALNTYFTGASSSAKSHVYQQNSDYHLKNNGGTEIVHISDNATSNTTPTGQIDVSSAKVTMAKTGGTSDKILKIDLDHTADTPKLVSDLSTETNNKDSYPVYIRKGVIELTNQVNSAYEDANTNKNVYNYVKADRFISNKKTQAGTAGKNDNNQDAVNGADLRGSSGGAKDVLASTNYIVNPAYTSVMRDIKLTSRGGARLSDILPDFINKGIYVVDNTYPAKGESCEGKQSGLPLATYQGKTGGGALASGKGYKKYSDPTDGTYVGQCDSSTQEVSPWLGFVPRPTCPPGYMAVITLTPTSFAMAQAGFALNKANWMKNLDGTSRSGRSSTADLITLSNSIQSPLDYTGEGAEADAPIPFYSQKNTWLKSDAMPYPSRDANGNLGTNGNSVCSADASCTGWDLSMGFIYPYQWYKQYITEAQANGGTLALDTQGPGSDDQKIIWNLFPVYAGTLEGYATVYCYFQRNPKSFKWNSHTVDTGYDQIGSYRDATNRSAAGSAKTNSDYQNSNDFDYGYW